MEATIEKLTMTWLITGASGQLGLAMQSELTERKIQYLAFASKDLDITKPESVCKMFSENSPSVVVNCAAWTDVDGAEANKEMAFAVNAFGPKNLAVASKSVGAILVHISTDYVFSGDNDSPWLEDAVRNPASVYGSSKCDGEKFVENLYPEGSYILRTAWLYSSNGKNFAKTMTRLALQSHGEVKVVNDQIGQPTSTRDLARQIVNLVLSKASYGIYHGTNGGSASWFDFAQAIFELTGADKKRVIPVSSLEFQRPAKRPGYSVLGHKSWEVSSVPKMRTWKVALADAMPEIIEEYKKEMSE